MSRTICLTTLTLTVEASFLARRFASLAKSSETDTVILQLIEQTVSRLKFTFSGNCFLYLRQSVSEFFHLVARCVNGITSVIWEFHRYQHSLCRKF